jgi:uncharacterized peroxidase-related enzyme
MARIAPLTIETAPQASRPVLEDIQANFGMVPNIFATIAASPTTLKSLMGLFGTLEQGELGGMTHEALALRVGQLHGCAYCSAAHSAKAKMAGASEQEILGFRKGQASDQKIQALLHLAEAMVEKRGQVSDEDLQQARQGGATDSDIFETLAVVVCNTFTNYINALAQTDVDFPPAPKID